VRPVNYYGPWSVMDKAELEALWPTEFPQDELAKKLGRSISALGRMARKMGLPHRPRFSSRVTHIIDCKLCGAKEPRQYLTYRSGKTWARIASFCKKCEGSRASKGYIPKGRAIFWTDERKELVKSLWQAHPASYIAAKIGVTRNAVIGVANRLGLGNTKPRPKPKPKPIREPKLARPPKQRARKAAASLLPVDAPPPLNLDIISNTGCKWPTQDKPYGECGHPRVHRRPYCEAHCRG
jgi:hypothetical protein